MTKPSKPPVTCTSDALHREFVNNNWKDRLEQCKNERVDIIKEYEEGEREYRKRIISQHFENKLHIAMTITKVFWDDHSTLAVKMLLIDDAYHVAR